MILIMAKQRCHFPEVTCQNKVTCHVSKQKDWSPFEETSGGCLINYLDVFYLAIPIKLEGDPLRMQQGTQRNNI